MPTYEYACKDCGEHVEVVQSFKDEPLTECPNCGGPLRKVFGSIGIVFKGSGFYRTDSRIPSRAESKAEKAEKAEKADKGDKGDKGDKSEAKTDTKAGSKADSKSKSDSKSDATPVRAAAKDKSA